jgi:hypothetical protein
MRHGDQIRWAAATLALLAACGGGTKGPVPATGARPASTATIHILQPTPGEVVAGSSLLVEVEVPGGRIVPQASRTITPDTGHVHLSVDGKIVTLLAGLSFEIKDVMPGRHLLQAEFVAADHGPFNPRVIATATFKVT